MSTGISTSPIANTQPMTLGAKLSDYLVLTKPRIVVLELIAVLIALRVATGYGAPGSVWSMALVLSVSLGTALVAGSANSLNQWLEKDLDSLMKRTANRPLPAGRLSPDEVLAFSVLSLAMGCSMLAMFAGVTASVVAFATWVVYVAFYTPMKTRTWFNTTVGALSGAMPLAIGWTAGGGALTDVMCWHLVGVMFLWQYPHFMAIAWLCREDYAKADYKMSTTIDPSGWWAGFQSVVGSALMIPVSLIPLVAIEQINWLSYSLILLFSGMVMLLSSVKFHVEPSDQTARKLMRFSLLYIPVWLVTLWLTGA